jgi:hypothetical protein
VVEAKPKEDSGSSGSTYRSKSPFKWDNHSSKIMIAP